MRDVDAVERGLGGLPRGLPVVERDQAAGVLDLPGADLDGRVLQVGKRRFRRLRVV